MLSELKYFFVLAVCWVSSAHPSSSNRQCSQLYISEIKEKYVKKIWEEADDLNKISEIIEDVTEEVDKKLRKLEETLQLAIEFAENKGFDINECLDLDKYNQIRNDVEKELDAIKERSEELFAYVQDAVSKVEVCASSYVSCKQIKKCAEKVEDNFDDDVIEDGVEELERYTDSFEYITIRQITADINSITKSIKKCYSNHLQKTTSTTTESEENVTESETAATGTDIPKTTESEENVTESETDTTSTDIPETTPSDTIDP